MSAMLKRRSCLAIAGDGLHRRCQPLPVYQILVLRVTPTTSDQTTTQRMVLDKQLQCHLYAKPDAAMAEAINLVGPRLQRYCTDEVVCL